MLDIESLNAIRLIIREELAKASAPVSTMDMKQVCEYLHLSRPAIYDRIDKGLLTPRHCGKRLLFDREQVMGLVK